jgi:hypothetical protein
LNADYCYVLLVYTYLTLKYFDFYLHVPIPVAAPSKAWVCGRSLPGIAGFNPAGGMDVSCESCVLSGRDLWSATECGVSECDREALTVKRPWPKMGCRVIKIEFVFRLPRKDRRD